jgi:hypothetical protein
VRKILIPFLLLAFCPLVFAQQILDNDSVAKMVTARLSDDIVISTIDATPGQYDTTPDAVIGLQHAGVSDRVIAAMVSKNSAAVQTSGDAKAIASAPAPAPLVAATPTLPHVGTSSGNLVLREGTDVPLSFAQNLSSKTASEGDPVVLLLESDLKIGDVVVARAGSRAFGEVTKAEKSGMLGKAGELSIRLDHLKVGDSKVRLRGAKGREGESGTTGVVVLTVLFGPIGLIKHGKNIEIKQGTPMMAYVADDITLAAAP